MGEQELRSDICEIGRRLWGMGMTPANAGNLSARLDDGRLLCTPTGVSKGFMQPGDLVLLSPSGDPLGPGRVSSEVGLHTTCYQQRPEVGGVVHVHPVMATAFACSQARLPVELLTESVCLLGDVPVIAAAMPGSAEVSAALLPHLAGAVAFLMANHGALTLGGDIWEAYHRMEVLEHAARVGAAVLGLGEPRPLQAELLRRLPGP